MSKRQGRKRGKPNSAAVERSEQEYRVGPGHPPREYQFRPGQSGNPTGAERKSPSMAPDLKILLERALNQKIKLRRGEREQLMTKAAAGIANLVDEFAAGDRHARRDLIALAGKLGVDLTAGQGAIERALGAKFSADDQALVDDYVRRRVIELNHAADNSDDPPEQSTDPQAEGAKIMSRSRFTNDCEIPDVICRLDLVSFVRRCFRTLLPNSELLMNWHIYALCYELEQVSIDGALTGRGGDIIILDDPLKAMDARSDSKRERVNELFTNTIYNRLDDKKVGAIIVPMQRLHPSDLSGFVQRSSDEWKTLSFPAIAEREERIQIGPHQFHERHVGDVLHPEREPLEILERIRSQMSAEDFAAQYQQNPIPPGGTMFNQKWILRYGRLPNPTSLDTIVQSWDTASKEGELNDYSVCCTILHHDQKIYLIDVMRERLAFPALRARAIAHARAHHARVILVEDAGVGTALVAELKNAGLPVTAVKPGLSKQIRASVQTQKFESGKILLPSQAPWLTDFEAELFAFPHSRHDDQVDSLCQALAHKPNTYDLDAINRGMETFLSGYLYQSMFRGRII